ncbi:MAG TPA: tetratricopeptide repeat protein, partial [Usitatibacter sp.]|nr:tetratricopeptide repeat protein [Usitatibacter sp.]
MDPSAKLEALLAAGKDSAMLRVGLGSQYLGKGEAARAAEHLRAALAQDPAYSAAWKLLGKALQALGDQVGAIEAYRS